tara:strand:+ start:238 stop:621 length:384 start_codon:yes stop_codon:yes gene_type:complete
MTTGSLLPATLLAAGLTMGSAAGAAGSDGLKAWLEPAPRGNLVQFQGYVTAPEPMMVHYSIKIVRISRGGRAATSQGGQVMISQPNEPTPLSVTSININQGDTYEAELVATGPGGEEVRVALTRKPD